MIGVPTAGVAGPVGVVFASVQPPPCFGSVEARVELLGSIHAPPCFGSVGGRFEPAGFASPAVSADLPQAAESELAPGEAGLVIEGSGVVPGFVMLGICAGARGGMPPAVVAELGGRCGAGGGTVGGRLGPCVIGGITAGTIGTLGLSAAGGTTIGVGDGGVAASWRARSAGVCGFFGPRMPIGGGAERISASVRSSSASGSRYSSAPGGSFGRSFARSVLRVA